MEVIKPVSSLHKLLSWVEEAGAADLHLQEGKPSRYRIKGQLKVLPADTLPPLSRDRLLHLLDSSLSASARYQIEEKREVDMSLQMGQTRWRANFSKQQGRQSCSFRVVPKHHWRLKQLRL